MRAIIHHYCYPLLVTVINIIIVIIIINIRISFILILGI